MIHNFDIVVIGAGSGGLTVAFGLAAAGKKVALIEKGLIGGDCTNYGCIPSKALIDVAASGKYNTLQEALVEVRKRRKKIQDEETPEKIESHGLKVFQGKASFIDEYTLQVGIGKIQKIKAKKIIISTGSHGNIVNIPGANREDILTNTSIFEQTQDIKKLVIIGGGYIACELAEALSKLNVQVYIVQRNMKIIPREEEESSKTLREIFTSQGIKIYTNSQAQEVKNNTLIVSDIDTKKTKSISFDKILMALGRSANLEGLNLEEIGIRYDKKGIFVDRYNRTHKKHIFAIGDCVKDNPQFTHWANNEGRGVIRNILITFPKVSSRFLTLPAVLYTNHEIARVGKTQQELKIRYNREEYVTKIVYFSSNDRSKITNDTNGFILIHFKRLSGKILGVTIFGRHAGEMIGVLTLAMDNKLSAYKLAKTIQAYPTKSDSIKRACDQFVIGTIGNIKNEIKYFLKQNILQIITTVIWFSIIVFFLYYKSSNDLSIEGMALQFYNFISGSTWGPFIYILAYTIRPIVLFPATLMTFMSGALFGFVGGFFLTWLGETMSSIFAYFLGGVFGKKLLSGEESSIIGNLKNKVNTQPFLSVLMTRFLFFPFDITNYACGFLRVRFKSYVAATALGIIPGMSVFILAGAAFYNKNLTSFSDALTGIDTRLLIYAAGLFIFTVLFAKVLKKITK